MPTWQTIVPAVMAVMLVLAVGALLRRINWLTEAADETLMRLTVRVLVPCLILAKTVGNPRLAEAHNLLWPPLVGYGTVLLGFLLAWLTARALGPALWGRGQLVPAKRRTFVLTTGMYNYAYLPIPLAALLFKDNDSTMSVLFVHNVGTELAMWTAGVLVLTGTLGGRGWWRRLINPPSVAVVLAVLLSAVRARETVPGFVFDAMRTLGDCAIPVSLLLVGATVADQIGQADWHKGAGEIVASALLRLGLLPLAFLALAVLLPVSLELKRVLALQAAMPAAMFPIVMAKYYGGDSGTAVRVVIASALLGLVTIPLWLAIGLGWVG